MERVARPRPSTLDVEERPLRLPPRPLPRPDAAVLAGLALLGAIANNLFAALEEVSHREASLITFLVTASGLSLFGLSSAFWGVVIGYGCYRVLNGGK